MLITMRIISCLMITMKLMTIMVMVVMTLMVLIMIRTITIIMSRNRLVLCIQVRSYEIFERRSSLTFSQQCYTTTVDGLNCSPGHTNARRHDMLHS